MPRTRFSRSRRGTTAGSPVNGVAAPHMPVLPPCGTMATPRPVQKETTAATSCGVAGFTPSVRLRPTAGLKPFAPTLDTAGLFAAGVRDVARLAAVLSGRRALDISDGEPGGSAPTIGLYRSAVDDLASPAMHEAWGIAASELERAGARVVEIRETQELAAGREVQPLLQLFEGAQSLLFERTHHADQLSPLLREALERGGAIEPERYDRARRTARAARRAASALFERCDALLLPSAPGAAPHGLGSTGDPAFNRLWTLTGNPCVNVPGACDADGMPLGLSVVARFGRDPAALALAALLEKLLRRR